MNETKAGKSIDMKYKIYMTIDVKKESTRRKYNTQRNHIYKNQEKTVVDMQCQIYKINTKSN